ncbi:Nogo-B receptor [Leucoagaricus sp. SymC.cos]|nr:Nogo-B receptor [Leucoagaricus sp. SymC.cos]
MDLVAALVLRVLHFLYALVSLFHSFWCRQTRMPPQPLHFPRRRLPKNLALVFVQDVNIPRDVVELTILRSCMNAIEWCQATGIPKLTIYEERGLVLRLESRIREGIFGADSEMLSSDTENEFQPLTPPASVYSDSCQLSPCHSMSDITLETPSFAADEESSLAGHHSAQQPISLCLISSNSSKVAIATLARSLYFAYKQKPKKAGQRTKAALDFSLAIDEINSFLESDSGLSSPDFMIVHPINPMQYNRTPLELHGFPPWHIRLTEIYLNQTQDKPRGWRQWLGSRLTYTPNPTILDEISFRDALDEFAAAEMRFGK